MAEIKTSVAEETKVDRQSMPIDQTDVTIIALALIGQTPKKIPGGCSAIFSDADWSVFVELDDPEHKKILLSWPGYQDAGISEGKFSAQYSIPKSNYLDVIRIMHKDVTAVSGTLKTKIAEGAGITTDKIGVYLAEVERSWKATSAGLPTWKWSDESEDDDGDDG